MTSVMETGGEMTMGRSDRKPKHWVMFSKKLSGHDIHPNYESSLETGVKTMNKRLFLESSHSFLEKISFVP